MSRKGIYMIKKIIATALVAASIVTGTTLSASPVRAAIYSDDCYYHCWWTMKSKSRPYLVGVRYSTSSKNREGLVKYIIHTYCKECWEVVDTEYEYEYLSEEDCKRWCMDLDSIR